jgi:hypothetical protein
MRSCGQHPESGIAARNAACNALIEFGRGSDSLFAARLPFQGCGRARSTMPIVCASTRRVLASNGGGFLGRGGQTDAGRATIARQ